MNYEDKKL